jgi:mannose-6-phosphate isomerase-like protein (cupin superfamily)
MLPQLVHDQGRSGKTWLEFLRVRALSMGVYTLAAGADDLQKPHAEDEIYYVVTGQAVLRIADDDRVVEPGTIAYVPAGISHHFHTITRELTALVFFAPAEGTALAGERH